MPVLPTAFGKHRGFYTDNDEGPRRRARGIAKLRESYEQGGAYSDIDRNSTTAERLDAAKDYDLFSRVRPSGQAMKKIVSGYSEKVKRGKK